MTDTSSFTAEAVDWSGENPNMYLMDPETGGVVSLISFFRVVLSDHGRGQGLILLEAPGTVGSTPEALNVCVTDNEPLARYLMANFVCHFGPFRDQPALQGIEYRRLDRVTTRGDARTSYGEHIEGDGITADLSWEELGTPFMVTMPAAAAATGHHDLFSMFVNCHHAVATVNGRRVAGESIPREFAGRQSTTAFLAFSETWVKKV